MEKDVETWSSDTFSATSTTWAVDGQSSLSSICLSQSRSWIRCPQPITTKSTDCACLEAIRGVGCFKILSILEAYNLRADHQLL
jgi:hypothetical protein